MAHPASSPPLSAIENWRDFFRLLDPTGVDPWTVCERALAISYLEDPIGFVSNRDALAQKLFAPEKLAPAREFPAHAFSLLLRSCSSIRFSGKPMKEPHPSWFPGESPDSIREKLGDSKQRLGEDEDEHDDDEDDEEDAEEKETGRNGFRSSSFDLDEAEALTRELEDEMMYRQEVLSIKRSLERKCGYQQSEKEVYESLRRLEMMDLSLDLLKETGIGKVVNGLRKSSPSTRVANLAKRLVRGWKELVHACCKSAIAVTAAATTKDTPADYGTECLSTQSVFDEEPGLPSPPMDEAALLGVSTASVDMFQLWDLMEDDVTSVDACPPIVKESNNKCENFQKEGETHSRIGTTINCAMERKTAKQVSDVMTSINRRGEETCNSHPLSRPQHKSPQKSENVATRHLDSIDERMESAKRNLRVNYEREQNAKKQRTIQVLDLHDLPKGGPARAKIPHLMHGRLSSHARPRALTCR